MESSTEWEPQCQCPFESEQMCQCPFEWEPQCQCPFGSEQLCQCAFEMGLLSLRPSDPLRESWMASTRACQVEWDPKRECLWRWARAYLTGTLERRGTYKDCQQSYLDCLEKCA